ncbi:MAG TPA: type IV pilus assembly protein PilM [Candidatus Saccharimonadales bacterium]|nr:type IV pilus assembly protein PilM [Candidatus Saccharimonadales bacterium]
MGSLNKLNKTPNFFRTKPLFGLDIGNGSLKVMQVEEEPRAHQNNPKIHKPPQVLGYGTISFNKNAIDSGVIVQPEVIAQAILELFEQRLIGKVTTRRVAISLPAYRSFTRSIQLPALKPQEIKQAVQLEAEQYVPVPIEELYLDYTILRQTKEGMEVMAVAVPQKTVNSYLELAAILGLEPVLIETTLDAAGKLFAQDDQSDVATMVIDFGSLSSDISIYDGSILATGTVQGGGEVFTNSIRDKLQVTRDEAQLIKTKYGLGLSKRQKEIHEALDPVLRQIVKEIHRMIRYYDERYGSERPIKQLIALGGGANMPGLTEYLTEALRLAVRFCDPWQYLNYKGLQPPANADKPMYATVAGLSLMNPKEVFDS